LSSGTHSTKGWGGERIKSFNKDVASLKGPRIKATRGGRGGHPRKATRGGPGGASACARAASNTIQCVCWDMLGHAGSPGEIGEVGKLVAAAHEDDLGNELVAVGPLSHLNVPAKDGMEVLQKRPRKRLVTSRIPAYSFEGIVEAAGRGSRLHIGVSRLWARWHVGMFAGMSRFSYRSSL